MPTMCVQCAMRAMLEGVTLPVFDESPEEHRARMHPDPVATDVERRELIEQLTKKLNQ